MRTHTINMNNPDSEKLKRNGDPLAPAASMAATSSAVRSAKTQVKIADGRDQRERTKITRGDVLFQVLSA